MIHIGTEQYFQAVQSVLTECDEVIFEGVRSFQASALTASYRWVTRQSRLGLASQRQALQLQKLPGHLVHADASGSEFEKNWKNIPWYFRLATVTFAPLFGIWLYLTATRRSLGKRLDQEDLKSREEILSEDAIPGFNKALIESRDGRLLAAIEEALNRTDNTNLVGIVYGAAHMRAVSHYLLVHHDYRIVESKWFTVIGYEY